MLLYLNSDLLGLFATLAQQRNHRLALENLAIARREGYHIVSGHPKVLEALPKLSALSSESRAIYKRVFEGLTQLGSLEALLPVHGRIVTKPGVNADPRGIEMPLSMFSTLDAIRPARLIAESLNDCKFYKYVGETAGPGALGIQTALPCQLLPGGGSDTYKTYGHYKPLPGITLVITDSDKMCPADKMGDTAKAVEEAHKRTPGIGDVVITSSKSVENLLPSFLLNRAFATGWNCDLGKAGLDAFCAGDSTLRFHADLKNGLKQRRFFDWDQQDPRHLFWKGRYKHLRGQHSQFSVECDDAAECESKDECECWITRSLGGGALEQVLNASENFTRSRVWDSLDGDLRGEWGRIGSTVVSWCCGAPRLSGL